LLRNLARGIGGRSRPQCLIFRGCPFGLNSRLKLRVPPYYLAQRERIDRLLLIGSEAEHKGEASAFVDKMLKARPLRGA
jgi:hypothetical protein